MVKHETLLQGANLSEPTGAGALVNDVSETRRPLLVSRTDQEFLPAVLKELRTVAGRALLSGTVARRRDARQRLTLLQPVHRTFHVVLLEAACNTPGVPRLDPARIESAGVVVRRVVDGDPGAREEAWVRAGESLRGWVPLGAGEPELDPEPARRRPALSAGHPEVDRLLAAHAGTGEALGEWTGPLFVAPPEVCEAAGRTLLYGLVPVTSSEVNEAPEPLPPLTDGDFSERDPIYRHLSKLLTATSPRTYGWSGRTLTPESRTDPALAGDDMDALVVCLEQLMVELDAFGETAAAEGMFQALDLIGLPYPNRRGGEEMRPAGQVLADAAQVLVNRAGSLPPLRPARGSRGGGGPRPGQVDMPLYWPGLDEDTRRAIFAAARAALDQRIKDMTPGEARFDAPDRSYRLRAFVRVRRDDGCPPELVWSRSSEDFSIAPWFESSDVPPVRVALPDATDSNFLKRLRPNVAFAVPEPIFNLMRGMKLDGLIEGKKPPEGGELGLGWLCGFNIPIITLCAFIVLSIFLSLLHILFFWLPLVKICIPFPKPR